MLFLAWFNNQALTDTSLLSCGCAVRYSIIRQSLTCISNFSFDQIIIIFFGYLQTRQPDKRGVNIWSDFWEICRLCQFLSLGQQRKTLKKTLWLSRDQHQKRNVNVCKIRYELQKRKSEQHRCIIYHHQCLFLTSILIQSCTIYLCKAWWVIGVRFIFVAITTFNFADCFIFCS